MDKIKINENYVRKVDKSKIPTCNILGVNIATITKSQLIDYVCDNLENIKGDYLCFSNVHTTMTAYENEDYKKVQNGGLMALPDGMPLAKIGKKRGNKQMKKIAGYDFTYGILNITEQKGYKHFFLGSTQEVLDKMKINLKAQFPNIQIVGMYSPPFREWTKEEDEQVISMINQSKPDFVWVGLGAPKQEIFMANHQGLINGLMVGIGGVFKIISGEIKRAPNFMIKHNMEWLYRFIKEPRRLFKRVFVCNFKFIWNVYFLRKK